MGLREIKMARTRRLISDKAFELFTENGYERTTIEQIAAAAEVGPRTLYRYFATKETLVIEFVRTSLFEALDDLRAQSAGTPLPVALHAVIGRVLQIMSTDPTRVLAVYDLAGPNLSVRAQLSDLLWQWRHGIADEVIKRVDGPSSQLIAWLTAGSVVNIIEAVVQAWVDSGGEADMHALAAETTSLLRTGAVPVPADSA
jgi:AcrR family transcriptional regulator